MIGGRVVVVVVVDVEVVEEVVELVVVLEVLVLVVQMRVVVVVVATLSRMKSGNSPKSSSVKSRQDLGAPVRPCILIVQSRICSRRSRISPHRMGRSRERWMNCQKYRGSARTTR